MREPIKLNNSDTGCKMNLFIDGMRTGSNVNGSLTGLLIPVC
jgi:hypothetical protein